MAYYKAYEEAFKNQDAEAVASLYTEDCTVLFMGNLVQGRTGECETLQSASTTGHGACGSYCSQVLVWVDASCVHILSQTSSFIRSRAA